MPSYDQPAADDYRVLFESAPGLYLVLRPDFTIVAASDAYLDAIRVRREEIVGCRVFDAFANRPDDDAGADGVAALRASLERAIRSRQRDDMPIRKDVVRRPDSEEGGVEERFWSSANTPVFDAEGALRYVIHQVVDVTQPTMRDLAARGEIAQHQRALQQSLAEARRAEDELRTARAAAEAANRHLEAFSASIAHDLRAPLRAVRGFSRALVEDCAEDLPPRARDLVERVETAAERMSELIDALLVLSRVTRKGIRPERVDLSAIARSIAAQLRTNQPGRVVAFDCEDGLATDGDLQLLRILLENLLGNAWKFTGKRGSARIRFGREVTSQGMAYVVQDDGAGFDMTHAHKLFAPFQRLHSAREFEGSGLGLTTAERIVQRHGGSLWADGLVDGGATFRFTIPSRAAISDDAADGVDAGPPEHAIEERSQ